MASPARIRDKLFDTAERLFAERGYHGTSMREITLAAGVNLAAVHYHIGDKQTFFLELIRRRLAPLNTARLAALETLVRDAQPDAPPLAAVLDAFARPLFALHRDSGAGGVAFVQILARSLVDPLPFFAEFLARDYHPITTRFAQTIRKRTAHLSPEEFLWRISFVVGSLHHTLATLHQMPALTRGICRENDHAAVLTRFISFGVTAFTAPATNSPSLASAAPTG